MTEAIEAGIKIMFKEYGMHRIEVHVMQNNKSSIRILEKMGFYMRVLFIKF